MRAEADILQLRRHLDELANEADERLMRYELRWPPMPPGWYWRARWLVGWILRSLERMKLKRPDPWPVSLKQFETAAARPLLVWAIGVDRQTLREAGPSIDGLRQVAPAFAPVLVTDIADFARFSRLGYLVEYLPGLAGEGEPYEKRKARMLARLYRGAPALTIPAILETSGRPDDIRRLINDQCADPK